MVASQEVGTVTGFSSGGIFLSYRREDAAPYARLLKYQLSERFPTAQVFMDLDSIEAGLDFAEVISEAVDSCTVLVALIGRQWVTLADKEARRRIDDPDDLVRFEVQVALERGVRVIPVLVDGAEPLRRQQLPAELHKLARLNALELSYGRYDYDAGRLIDLIHRVLAATSGAVDQSPPTAKAEAPTVLRGDRSGSNAPSETARKDAVNTEVIELPGDEQPTRVEREIAVLKRFDVPPEKGLNREEASRAFSDNGISPRACGSWTQHGWITREGDRRWLSDKGRGWVRDQLGELATS